MRSDFVRVIVWSAFLPLLASGCAVQGGGAAVDAAARGDGATQAAAVAPLSSNTAATASVAPSRPAKSRPTLAPPSELEARHGVQITQVGLVAAGGLVDLRFKILDATKARRLLADPANAPVVIAPNGQRLVPPHRALHNAKLADGLVYYVLYPNARNAVTAGSEVSIAMGNVSLGPVVVR